MDLPRRCRVGILMYYIGYSGLGVVGLGFYGTFGQILYRSAAKSDRWCAGQEGRAWLQNKKRLSQEWRTGQDHPDLGDGRSRGAGLAIKTRREFRNLSHTLGMCPARRSIPGGAAYTASALSAPGQRKRAATARGPVLLGRTGAAHNSALQRIVGPGAARGIL